MAYKLNIGVKGKAWKLELEGEALAGKSIGDTIKGAELKPELEGYEFKITGGSDFAGFPMSSEVEGIGLKGLLLTKGWGMWTSPKGEKKKSPRMKKGLRLKKTVRGRTISDKTVQINFGIVKEGAKKLEEVFPDQNKKAEPAKAAEGKGESPAHPPIGAGKEVKGEGGEVKVDAPKVEVPKVETKAGEPKVEEKKEVKKEGK